MNTLEFSRAYRPGHRDDVRDFSWCRSPHQELDRRLGITLLRAMQVHGDPDGAFTDSDKKWFNEAALFQSSTTSNYHAINTLIQSDPERTFIEPLGSEHADITIHQRSRLYTDALYEAMSLGWSEIVFGYEPKSAERQHHIAMAQMMLAVQSLRLALVRQKYADISEGHRYFSPEFKPAKDIMDGIMTEYDTALVLLALSATDPGLKTINAPSIFENEAGCANVDFIAFHEPSNSVTGIQAKARATAEDDARYDPERVLIVDGSRDFKGDIFTRTRAGSSSVRSVTWPGVIAAEHIVGIKLHGHGSRFFHDAGLSPVSHFHLRHLASQTLHLKYSATGKPLKGTYQYAKVQVGNKLRGALGIERPAPAARTCKQTGSRRKR